MRRLVSLGSALLLYLAMLPAILFAINFLLLMFERARGQQLAAHEDAIIQGMVLIFVLAAVVATVEYVIVAIFAAVRRA